MLRSHRSWLSFMQSILAPCNLNDLVRMLVYAIQNPNNDGD